MSGVALEARGLAKAFGGVRAVRDFTLSVPAGAIYGLIGPNGAGKTTSMRMLATLLPPSAGDAWVGGASIRTEGEEVRRRLGYMPDFFGVYPELKVSEYLDFYAACHGVPPDRRAHVAADLLELVDLVHKRDAYVEGLSRGMQQRLGLARALVHDPPVLLLDEPASGLDPRARLELREVVRELGQMGKAILISSHILAELTDVCSHIAIVDGGRVLVDGPLDEVSRKLRGGRSVRIQVLGEGERLRYLLLTTPGVNTVELEPLGGPPHQPFTIGATDDGASGAGSPGGGDARAERGDSNRSPAMVRFVLDGDERTLQTLLADLVRAGLPIYSFAQEAVPLEAMFLQVTHRLGEEQEAEVSGQPREGSDA
ncbi:MAG: ABC transporter ATP-binding protein [Chloroflexi bacterium]|nr:ABC transporter ATP-binding protein [Chloroflexota bacterium]